MAYLTPTVSSAGLTIPTYTDIRDDLIETYKSIYGQDVYLENDSADYQWISAVALKISDAMQGLQLDYNCRSPWTAIGAALDGIVKLNGLTRKSASYSSCVVTLYGGPGTIISNGIVEDLSGYKWDLPASCTIGSGGSIAVTAVCETIGAISALASSIVRIVTPQAGWTSVTNLVAAVVGQPVETDSQLRARQALSVKMASHTMLSGTIAAIAAVSGVTRYNVLENYTDSTDTHGNPEHSITAVVEGGSDEDVAMAIYMNRGLGCYTNGTTLVDVEDPDSAELFTMAFERPSYIPIFVEVTLTPLIGYTTATRDAIETAIVDYLNALQIGENLTISALYGVALSVMADLTRPTFSITELVAGTTDSPLMDDDIVVAFNEVTQGIAGTSPAYVTVNDGLSP